MAIPNYTYLKLKMPRPQGVITVSTSFQRAYLCSVESCECAAAAVASGELADIWHQVVEDAPDSKRAAGSFEPTEEVKAIKIDPNGCEDKTVHIGT